MITDYRIAALVTCHNRVKQTLLCLKHLYQNTLLKEIDVYLVDDASSDNTTDKVGSLFSSVKIISGSGYLYWAGGMNLAWKTAAQSYDYDFYVWLNDDTILYPTALDSILSDYLSLKEEGIESLIVGIFQDPDCKKTTYSGRLSGVRLSPSGLPQFCDYITGNFVLISKTIFDSVGFLDKRFTHGIADNDYGKMVLKNGFQCHTTSHYVGTCKLNGKVKWFDPSLPFKERYSRMKSPLNGNIFEYVYYIRKHDGFFQAVLVLVKSYFRLLFPRIFT